MNAVRLFLVATVLASLMHWQGTAADEPVYQLSQTEDSGFPEPDYDGLAQAAGRVVPGESYVEALPVRREICANAALPYSDGPSTSEMVVGMTIDLVCLRAMMHRLAELYYAGEDSGADSAKALFDRLDEEMALFFRDAFNGTRDCFDTPPYSCGTMNTSLTHRSAHLRITAELVELMALGTGLIRDVPAWQKAWAEQE
jgi:hypothetical protein